MNPALQLQPLWNTFIPVITVCLAVVLTLTIRPKGLMVFCIQASAAGILLAGIAVELLPKLNFASHGLSLTVAFFLGLALMLLLKKLNPDCCGSSGDSAPLTPFVTAFCIEFLLNGMMIYLAGMVSAAASLLVGISLGICCFVCGMSVATRLKSAGYASGSVFGSLIAMACLFPLGAVLIWLLLGSLPFYLIDDVIAFGIAVLLYIACADLLMGSFKNKHSLIRVFFFAGFVLILLLKAYIA